MFGRNKFLSEATYKSVLRTTLIEKLNLMNTYSCPSLRRGRAFVELKRLENFDNSRLLAAIFILRLLGGRKPYVLRFGLFQTFHTRDYDAAVVVDFNSKASYKFVESVSLNILPFVAEADFSCYASENKEGVVVNFTISDLSFIRVVETHSIFFKWHDKVNAALIFNSTNLELAKLLLELLKFKP